MRGRYPSGPEFVEHLSGSVIAKNRARVLLETLAGICRVKDACVQLGISEPRFDQLRIHSLEQFVQSMEPRTAGRPPRTPSPAAERIRELEDKVAALEMQVKIAQARAEIALVLPNAVHDAPQIGVPENGVPENDVPENDVPEAATAVEDESEKKTNRPPRRKPHRPRPRAPASKKVT
jgi:hypothetical protein